MKKERKEVKGNEVKELIKEVKGVENKMNKEVKGVEKMNNKNKEVKEVIKEVKLVIDNEYMSEEIKEREEVKGNKGGKKMKESKELVEEIEAKRGLLMEKVLQWALKLQPVRDVHVKIKGRYYPLLGKETGKIYLIDKVKGKKVPFDTLEDQKMMYVICTTLAERKEEIEKEVQEEKRKYLEKRLQEVNELLNKF